MKKKEKKKTLLSKIKHLYSNISYKRRYDNLIKKYNLLVEECERREKKYNKDYTTIQLNQANKDKAMYKKQRDQLRIDYINLQKTITSKESWYGTKKNVWQKSCWEW